MSYLMMKAAKTVEEAVPVIVPTDWGMLTDKGNELITEYAQRAYNAAIQYKSSGEGDPKYICYGFVLDILYLARKTEFREVEDTDIKEQAASYHGRIYTAMTGDSETAYEVWEQHHANACEVVYGERETLSQG